MSTPEAVGMDAESECGRVTWHTSEEGGRPDSGISLGLGDGKILWCGEISKQCHTNAGKEAAALGDDFGFWIILYGKDVDDTQVIAKCANRYVGQEMMDVIAAALAKALGQTEAVDG